MFEIDIDTRGFFVSFMLYDFNSLEYQSRIEKF